MRRVMKIFWIVRKRFSPYVEKGKPFREEYARVMAYEDVSRMYAVKERPLADWAPRTE